MEVSGRTSREKSIIDVLIFGIGHFLHHPPTSLYVVSSLRIKDYHSKASIVDLSSLKYTLLPWPVFGERLSLP
jgi:hypothetical protein